MADARPRSKPGAATWRGAEEDPQDWMSALRSARRERDAAQARLNDVLLLAARREARRRWSPTAAQDELNDLARKAATAAVLAIANDLGGYGGGARFMTWACKYVIYRLSDEAGRRFWLSCAPPTEELDWKRLATRPGAPAAGSVQWREMCAALGRAVDDELTVSQRAVFTAVTFGNLPAEALTSGLGSSRNAIYQALFEARRKVVARLTAEGILPPGDMPPSSENRAHWLADLLAADAGDAGCDVAFQSIDRYAEAELDATGARHRFPGVEVHLACCGPCGVDYQGLAVAARRGA
jgi:DNA-directed RNA polymerase specialized sigma24 family protein